MATDAVSEAASAKLNLCLHVTGRRGDGYHLLDSLVVFADVADRVSAAPGQGLSLRVTGPEGAGLGSEPDNLVLRAARSMGVTDAALLLEKHLPVAAGIGGGSADAAAALRALARWTGRPLPSDAEVLRLGADVPVCLSGRPARMTGIGEGLTPLPPLPALWVVLVNPRVAVPTPQVFAALTRRDNLLASAGDMKNTLETAQDALAEAVEDLKKVELLDQREQGREVEAENKAEQAEYDEIGRLRKAR